MSIDANTSLNDLFEVAISTLPVLQTREIFIVKELFRGFEWNRIPKGTRTKLGSMFYNYACHNGITLIECLGKTPQNQQRYKML